MNNWERRHRGDTGDRSVRARNDGSSGSRKENVLEHIDDFRFTGKILEVDMQEPERLRGQHKYEQAQLRARHKQVQEQLSVRHRHEQEQLSAHHKHGQEQLNNSIEIMQEDMKNIMEQNPKMSEKRKNAYIINMEEKINALKSEQYKEHKMEKEMQGHAQNMGMLRLKTEQKAEIAKQDSRHKESMNKLVNEQNKREIMFCSINDLARKGGMKVRSEGRSDPYSLSSNEE
jgi:hypothetical protein